MASRRPFFAADPATDPQFVGDPAAHGLDKPIGGGFSIMQNLVKDQRQEMHEQSKGGQPKMAAADGRPKFAFEVTKKEWEAALLSDEKLLAKMKQDLNSMERGGSVANLTPENAKMVIRGLEQIIGNKKHLLSKFASMKTRRAARRPVSIVVELGGQQGHYIIDNGYRAVSPGELPEMIAKAFKARIQRSMAGMFGPEFQGVEIELPTTQMIQELRDELLQSRSGKATIVLDLNTDRYTFKRAALYSRRAMYWSSPERIYRLTKREIVDSSALCPKCRKEMELEPYTKTDRMYRCQLCGFKIPRSSVIVASLKSRRATNHLTNSQQFD
jgi:DNA-directed RNA polymerase subunit RPC12/RpoP